MPGSPSEPVPKGCSGEAVGEAVPIGSLPAEIERQAADAVIRKIIFQQDRDICIGTQFAGTQGGDNSRVTSTDDQESHGHLTLSYLIEFFLKSECVDCREGQAEKEADTPVERLKGLAERAIDLLLRPNHCSGVRDSPMRCHGLARPKGTDLIRRVVADREYKAQVRRVRFREFVP